MNITRALAVAFLTVLALASPALAQSSNTAVAAVNTPVFIAPDATKTPLCVASAGTSFVVLEDAGEWTKVQFQDPQWGRRVGYVATRDLRFHREALQPMDLSVRPEAPGARPPAGVSEPTSSAAPAPPRFEPAHSTAWPNGYVVGRTGLTFGTRTAPLLGIEVGSQVAPTFQVYGAFDWHRDISPQLVQDLNALLTTIAGADVEVRLPTYTLMAGVKAIVPRGSVRPYALGGFGYGRVNGTIVVEGRDVTGLLESLGAIDKSDIDFNKALFEIGGGFEASHGPLFVDVSYRFRKFLQTGSPINVSGLYAGAGVGF